MPISAGQSVQYQGIKLHRTLARIYNTIVIFGKFLFCLFVLDSTCDSTDNNDKASNGDTNKNTYVISGKDSCASGNTAKVTGNHTDVTKHVTCDVHPTKI